MHDPNNRESRTGFHHGEQAAGDTLTRVTSSSGYLLRERPPDKRTNWPSVPVGRAASLRLAHGLTEREVEIMRFAERFRMVTLHQVRRAFFNSDIPAFKLVHKLRMGRFLAKLDIPAAALRSSLGLGAEAAMASDVPDVVLVLDWNGYYYLRYHADPDAPLGYGEVDEERQRPGSGEGLITRWHPASVAQTTSRLGHTLAVSDVWSYVTAAARATYERPTPQYPDDPIKYRLKVFVLNEREAGVPLNPSASFISLASAPRVLDKASQSTRSPASPASSVAGRSTSKFLLMPDATIAYWFKVALPSVADIPGIPGIPGIQGMPSSHRIDYSIAANPPDSHAAKVSSGSNPGRLPESAQPRQSSQSVQPAAPATSHTPHHSLWNPPGGWKYWEPGRKANRYDRSLDTWQPAILHDVPFPARDNTWDSALFAQSSPFSARIRYLFVELETGANNRANGIAKIAAYNHLYKRRDIWEQMYGPHFPRVLVVVRTNAQLQRTVALWRGEFALRAQTAVLVTSLERLRDAHSFGRRGLIELPCWLDAFGTGFGEGQGPVWRTLDDALGIDLLVHRAEEALYVRTQSQASP
ncbi:MAG TPA: hypothetical protein VJ183_11245 [Chloroflexia bacterium]|nr:hypothetical protein [Chloroflexia bacterium]